MLVLLVFYQVLREVAGGVFCFLGGDTEKPNLVEDVAAHFNKEHWSKKALKTT